MDFCGKKPPTAFVGTSVFFPYPFLQGTPIMKYALSQISADSAEFASCPASVRDGIKFLKSADFSQYPNGKTVIETDDKGDRIYINILEYDTRSPREAVIEKHEKYIDVHYVISGSEYMGTVKYQRGFPCKTPYDPDIDMTLFTSDIMPFFTYDMDSPQKFVVDAGEFVIFAPIDLHASMIFIDKPERVRKVIVKCRV